MQEAQHIYISIDLKSFFASVECVERGLDPMTTHLVVADVSRTEKTICLAVTPALKAEGIPGRPRLFEVAEKTAEINARRRLRAPGRNFTGKSTDAKELAKDASLALSYLTAVPRMACYMEYSTRIYGIYLRYIASEDIHIYSVDEVFMDVTQYLDIYGLTPRGLAERMIKDVLRETGITATAGIGTNLYLAKVAMDIVAKHAEADADGVRIAELDELSYRRLLWGHRPLTDFWRVGRGYQKKLEAAGLYTMGDIARCSLGRDDAYHNAELLYRMFGINAELLIDHAWGYEPCRLSDIRSYRPERSSISSGQVLQEAYPHEKAGIIVEEMADSLAMTLLKKHLATDRIDLTVGYDIENLMDENIRRNYRGEVKTDHYGRAVPKHAHGSVSLGRYTSSARMIQDAAGKLYKRIADPSLLVRRVTIAAENLKDEDAAAALNETVCEQLELFRDYGGQQEERKKEEEILKRERKLQQAILYIRERYGGNAVFRGLNLREGATGRERNRQIGGHRA